MRSTRLPLHWLTAAQVVVLTDAGLARQLEIDDFTHANGIQFISADVRGLFGSVFCDFGPRFPVIDTNGEQSLTGMITSVDRDVEGLVTTLDETRHGLEDGDHITFSEIEGMTELNGCEPRKITVTGPYTFKIGDTSSFSQYQRGGLYKQVKVPKLIDFVRPAETSSQSAECCRNRCASRSRRPNSSSPTLPNSIAR